MKIKNILRVWLPFAVVTTAFCALVYLTVQQALRNGANDPQIQMAEDVADALNSGSSIESVVSAQKVYFDKSLAPFLVIYDSSGQPVAGSGVLDGRLPVLPNGVLDYAKQNGENRLTWQPNSSVRVAAVIVPFKDGYVLAGRNLREAEKRELQTETFAGVIWALALLASLLVVAFGETVLVDKKS
ncbi:MAG: hypothetical protein HY258_13620 [Chloroflexi bacterium]|nr:hypothetical protein [Chloroflexota bacterium]